MQLLAMPYSEMLAALADECDLSRRQAARATNTLAVAASAALLGLADDMDGLDGQISDEERERLLSNIGLGIETLTAVQPLVAEDWDGWDDDHDRLGWLLHTPASDVNFKHHLEHAAPQILRYALALEQDRPGNKTRAQALERRLRNIGGM